VNFVEFGHAFKKPVKETNELPLWRALSRADNRDFILSSVHRRAALYTGIIFDADLIFVINYGCSMARLG
jgi:hypothetical protein